MHFLTLASFLTMEGLHVFDVITYKKCQVRYKMQCSPNFGTHFKRMFFLTFLFYSLANALVESAYGTYGKH